MTEGQAKELQPGQLIRNTCSGQVYQVLEVVYLLDGRVIPVAVRAITMANYDEWEKV